QQARERATQCRPRRRPERHQPVELCRRAGGRGLPRRLVDERRDRRHVEDLVTDCDADRRLGRAAARAKDAERQVLDREIGVGRIGARDPTPTGGIMCFVQRVHCAVSLSLAHIFIVEPVSLRYAARKRPPSQTMIAPVVTLRRVTQARIARATSSGCTIFLSGVPCATFSSCAGLRPGTKSVFTAPGDTHSTRISGPSARPSDLVMVSSAAFAAQYATLEPEPVKPEI